MLLDTKVREKYKQISDAESDLVDSEKKIEQMRVNLFPKDEEDTYFD
jgi:hypothetical protein